MSLLDDTDLASMRATLDDSLPGTAVIGSNHGTSDGGGGGTTTFTASGTVACRVAPMSGFGSEPVIAGRLAENANWIVTLPAETPIDRQDRIVVDGRTFEVLAMHAPRSWELSRRVECNEVV